MKEALVVQMESRKNDIVDGKLRWELLPLDLVEKIVEVYHFGAKKYAPNTWKGLENGSERYYSAHLRHLCAWRKGEKKDSESGLNHLQHCIWNLMAVLYFDLNEKENE